MKYLNNIFGIIGIILLLITGIGFILGEFTIILLTIIGALILFTAFLISNGILIIMNYREKTIVEQNNNKYVDMENGKMIGKSHELKKYSSRAIKLFLAVLMISVAITILFLVFYSLFNFDLCSNGC